jgi:hypothetical protein
MRILCFRFSDNVFYPIGTQPSPGEVTAAGFAEDVLCVCMCNETREFLTELANVESHTGLYTTGLKYTMFRPFCFAVYMASSAMATSSTGEVACTGQEAMPMLTVL